MRREFVALHPLRGLNVGDIGSADGERAGRVHGQGGHTAELLDVHAALDQDAVACRLCDARKYRRRCADGERARRCRDQERHRPVERGAPRPDTRHRPDHGDEDGGDQDDRDEHPFEPIRESLGGGLLGLSLLDEFDDPVEGAIAGRPGRLDLEGAVAVDRTGKNLVALILLDRYGLAGDGGLIDGGSSRANRAVDGNSLPWPHDHPRPGLDLLDGNVPDLTVL